MPECPYTDWEDWSKCIGEFCGAGQVGSRTRTRNCIPAVSMTWKDGKKIGVNYWYYYQGCFNESYFVMSYYLYIIPFSGRWSVCMSRGNWSRRRLLWHAWVPLHWLERLDKMYWRILWSWSSWLQDQNSRLHSCCEYEEKRVFLRLNSTEWRIDKITEDAWIYLIHANFYFWPSVVF